MRWQRRWLRHSTDIAAFAIVTCDGRTQIAQQQQPTGRSTLRLVRSLVD
jgi:hypothetical protein